MQGSQDQYASIYYSTLIASLGGLILGYSIVLISGVLLFLDNNLGLGLEQQEIIVSIAILGAIFGTLLGGVCSNLFGRKATIIISAIIFIIASILSLFADQYSMLVISRVVMGVGAGMVSMAVPIYISEIVPSNIRGSCVCILTLLFYLGVLLAYLIDSLFAHTQSWKLTLSSPFIPAVGLLIGMCYMPETPQWLMGNGKTEKAVKSLGKLRRSMDVDLEVENMKESTQFNEKLRSRLWGKGVLKAAFIGYGIAFFMEITGAHALFYYMPTVLKTTGLWTESTAISSSIYIGVVCFVGALLAILLIDRHGRRKLLLYGTSIMVLALVGLGITFHFTIYCQCHHGLILFLFLLYAGGFVVGLSSVGWLLISEIFPLKVRSFLIATAITIKWSVSYVVSRFYLTQLSDLGGPLTFWAYAAISVICLLFIYYFVPETGGKSLEAIEEYWLTDSKHGIAIE